MKYDVVVIGGGIVGLATALNLLNDCPVLKLLVLEKEADIAQHQTGHNSGVIHSGIYYTPNSLKAKNCLRGYALLKDFCTRYDVPFDICGKVIVATTRSEIPYLKRLFERGHEHGLSGIKQLHKKDIEEYEPHVRGLAGIFVPQTGIVDFVKVARQYAALIAQKGGSIRLQSEVFNIEGRADERVVHTTTGEVRTDLLVNCAGLYCDRLAAFTERRLPFRIIPFRGEYYMLKPERQGLIRNLVYPVPDPHFPFLGVHFTRTIDGRIEAGPNAALAWGRESYQKSDVRLSELALSLAWPGFQKVMWKYWKTGLMEMYRSYSKQAFTRALQKLVPSLQSDDLTVGGAGVRAQACSRDGKLIDDFMTLESRHIVHVCNAPSPAATASLAVGEMVAERVRAKM